jgi:hypothetical protein
MRGLTIEQAADKAEIKLSYFRYLMAQLNGTSMDLRTLPVAGERARRYSPQKLAAWMAAGKPLPGSERATPDSAVDGPHVAATAHRAENGSGWVMTLQDPSHTVEATSLKRAWEISRVRAAELLDVDPEAVSVDFQVQYPKKAAALFEEHQSLAAEARELQEQADKKRLEGLRQLRVAGWRQQEMAFALGLTPQRIQQLLAEG